MSQTLNRSSFRLRKDHYLILQLIKASEDNQAQAAESASKHGMTISVAYHEGTRTSPSMGPDWASWVDGQGVSMTDEWEQSAQRRFSDRARKLVDEGFLRRKRIDTLNYNGGSQWSYMTTASGRRALKKADLAAFPHTISFTALAKQQGVLVSEIDSLRDKLDAAVQKAVDQVLWEHAS